MAILKRIGLAMLAVLVSGVAAFIVWAWPALYVPPVRDFRLIGVERVTRDSFRPCDTADMECLPGLPFEDYLRVRVASDRNLMDHAVAHELNIWKEVWSCDGRPDQYAGGPFFAPGPYVDEAPIPYGSSRGAAEFYTAIGKGPGARLLYDIYIVPRQERAKRMYEAGKDVAPPYDITDGRDICLRIGGGNMVGGPVYREHGAGKRGGYPGGDGPALTSAPQWRT